MATAVALAVLVVELTRPTAVGWVCVLFVLSFVVVFGAVIWKDSRKK